MTPSDLRRSVREAARLKSTQIPVLGMDYLMSVADVALHTTLTALIADLEAQYATTEMTTPCSFDALDECGRIIDWLEEIKKAVTP